MVRAKRLMRFRSAAKISGCGLRLNFSERQNVSPTRRLAEQGDRGRFKERRSPKRNYKSEEPFSSPGKLEERETVNGKASALGQGRRHVCDASRVNTTWEKSRR